MGIPTVPPPVLPKDPKARKRVLERSLDHRVMICDPSPSFGGWMWPFLFGWFAAGGD